MVILNSTLPWTHRVGFLSRIWNGRRCSCGYFGWNYLGDRRFYRGAYVVEIALE